MATYQERKGRWRAILRRKGLAPKTATFPTKTLAKAWAERIERELVEQRVRGDRDLDRCRMLEVFAWYRQTMAGMKTISATQAGNLRRLEEGLGQITASQLAPADIIEHVRRRRVGDHVLASGLKAPGCGAATMTVELTYLAEVLKLAKSMGKLSTGQDPVQEARPALRHMKLVGKPRKRDRRPTDEELERLHTYFEAGAWRSMIPMGDIIDFAITTGRRESEITRLLWSDVDPSTRTALLRDVKHPRKKDGNHKRFPLLGRAWEIAQKQPRQSGDDRVFPFNNASVGTAFTRACKNLGIKDLRFHDLRHEATSRLFEQGYKIEEVAAVTLHESWTELKRYTQLRPESLHRDLPGQAVGHHTAKAA
jgi:integrase